MRRRAHQNGMTTVEMALVGTLFFTLLFGALQLGNWVLDRTVMMNAAMEGARVFAATRHYATPYARTRSAVNARLSTKLQIPAGSSRMVLSVTQPGTTPVTCNSDSTCRSALGTDPTDPIDVKIPPASCLDPGTTASVNLQWTTPIFSTIRLPGTMSVTMSEIVQGTNKEPCP